MSSSSYLPSTQTPGLSDLPTHVEGTNRGEEFVLKHGREPGRTEQGHGYRQARDSTSLNPEARQPIDPRMPNIPPA